MFYEGFKVYLNKTRICTGVIMKEKIRNYPLDMQEDNILEVPLTKSG